MLKKFLAIAAAVIITVLLLPNTYGEDTFGAKRGVKDSERYYHRLKNMRRNNPDNPDISYQIANFFYARDMVDKAIEEYRRVLRLDKNHQQAKWFLSQCLKDKGYFEEAFWLVRELIDLNKKDYELYDEAGTILVKMGEKAASKEYFDKVDELKYGEKDGGKPIPSFVRQGNTHWKELFY